VWRLTEKGQATHLDYAQAQDIFRRQVKIDAAARKQKLKDQSSETDIDTPQDVDLSIAANYRDRLLAIIQALPFDGFEWVVRTNGVIDVRSGVIDVRRYYRTGPHSPENRSQTLHTAFHAESAQDVDRVHGAMVAAGATVLDAPADYTGQRGYSTGYYAAFYADPDGIKIEVAHIPESNP
jgi:catechol 2,3-dioxygenase-like lactoylglutathione lyase family enzyme